jgi:photosystem II stability/assembly factor-like uncharacterized protein
MIIRAAGQQTEPRYDPEGSKQRFDSLLDARRAVMAEDPSKEEDVEGRWAWFYYQRAFPYDVVPADVRLKAVQQTQAMEARLNAARSYSKGSSLLAVKQWEQVGPYNITGRIRGLALDPAGSGTLYIGAASGGVWKNNGVNQKEWTSSFDKLSSLALGAVAIDPTDINTIYAGTGEPLSLVTTFNASPAYWGDGMFKSTDGGQSWKNIGLGNSPAFSKIYVHRQNHNIVYAAGNQGGANFFRSEDGGQTWTNGFSSSTSCSDMAVNPVNSNTVFVTTTTGIWRSYDGGKLGSFKNVITSTIPTNASQGIAIAISASDTNIIYVLTSRATLSGGNDQGDVYYSSNNGTSWKKVATFGGDFYRNQGFYDNCIAVHPANPDIVIVGGVQLMRTEQGRTPNAPWTVVGGDVELHPDQHVIEFDPANPDVVYVGNDGGLWVSYDGGAQWSRYSLKLPITQFYQMDVDQTREFRVFGGTQDNGTNGALTDSKFADEWVSLVGGDGFYAVVDKTDPNIFYGEVYYGDLTRCSGDNYQDKIQLDGSIPSDDGGQWSTPTEMSPADKTTLFQGRSFLYRMADPRGGGLSWDKLDPRIGGDKISAIGLSPFDVKKILIGTASGQLRMSTDNGAHWTTPKGIPGRYVTDVIYDPVKDGRVYVVISGSGAGHVYRSDDDGANFVNVTNNLPDIPTNALEIDPNNNQHIFVGNDIGVFVSIDGGSTWLPFNNGMPYVPVTDLKVQRNFRKLYAATYGRSIFRIDIDDPQGEPFLVTPAAGSTFNTPGSLTVKWAGFTTPVNVEISYDNGGHYQQIGDDIPPTVSDLTVQLPIVKTDQAKVRVTDKVNGIVAESGLFSIKPSTNASSLTKPSPGIAEAIAVRHGEIWVTLRNSDSIYVLEPVLYTAKHVKVRTGFSGHIRSLAYDQTRDIFYALVTDNDYGNPHIFKMDTNGVGLGELALPSQVPTSLSGITVTPEGLAMVSPGKQGVITVVDPSTSTATLVSQSSPLVDASGSQRIGLTWDNYGYVQGVVDARPGEQYPTELQLEKVTDQFRVHQRTQAVTVAGGPVDFYAIAYDPTQSSQISYLATDTSGQIYRFVRSAIFSSVNQESVAGIRSGVVSISAVTPNPLRGQGSATFTVRSRTSVTLDLYTSNGDHIAHLFDGTVDAGAHSIPFDASNIPSGVYYMTLTTPGGDRAVRPVAVMR